MGRLIEQCYDQKKLFKHNTSITVLIISESIKLQLTEPSMAGNLMLITYILNNLQNLRSNKIRIHIFPENYNFV